MTSQLLTLTLAECTLAKFSLVYQPAANEVPLPFTRTRKPPLIKLYSYSKKTVK